jgi:NADH dehydrogenase/NADH:ubiquinone oxidoreductase subunit G
MTDLAGGAAAPADTNAAVIEHVDAPPNPINSEIPAAPIEDKPVEPAKVPTTREALRAAAEKVEKGQTEEPAKPVKTEQPRENGKFAPKEGDKPVAPAKPAAIDPAAAKPSEPPAAKPPVAGEKPAAVDPAVKPAASTSTSPAPARFSPDAKAVWDTAPEPVKAEVTRMERELTAGLEKHRVAAERDSKIAPFHEMAAKSGTDVHTALTKYTNMETLLRQNPLKGIEAVCDNIGVSLKDVARIVLGQAPEHEQSQQDATIRDLRSTVQRLEQQLTGVTQRFQQQDEGAIHEQIADWAKDKPLFEVLAPHIASEMRESGSDLDTAYAAVLQKHPQLAALSTAAPAAKTEPVPPAASSAAATDHEAQTLKGQKSITGAPGSGSEPAAQPRSSSIKEALKRAAARAG